MLYTKIIIAQIYSLLNIKLKCFQVEITIEIVIVLQFRLITFWLGLSIKAPVAVFLS